MVCGILEWLKFFVEKYAKKKEELRKELIAIHYTKFLSKMNTIQHENGGLYLLTDEMTWADLVIAQYIGKLEKTVGYPHLRKMKDAVERHPNIKEWLVKDRKTASEFIDLLMTFSRQ